MRNISLHLTAFALLVLPLATVTAQAGASTQSFSTLVYGLIRLFLNPLIFLLVSLTMLVFLFNLARYVWTIGDSKAHSEAMQYIGWSLLGLFVMFGVWGIVRLGALTIFGSTPR